MNYSRLEVIFSPNFSLLLMAAILLIRSLIFPRVFELANRRASFSSHSRGRQVEFRLSEYAPKYLLLPSPLVCSNTEALKDKPRYFQTLVSYSVANMP